MSILSQRRFIILWYMKTRKHTHDELMSMLGSLLDEKQDKLTPKTQAMLLPLSGKRTLTRGDKRTISSVYYKFFKENT